MRTHVLIALALSLAVVGAQQPQAPSETKKLDNFLGDWTGKGTFIGPEDAPFEITSTLKGSYWLKGRFMRLDVSLKGTPFGDLEGLVLMSYDDGDRRYMGYFFISEEPYPLLATGRIEGNIFAFLGSPYDDDAIVRVTFDLSKEEELGFKLEQENNGEYNPVLTVTYKKSPVPKSHLGTELQPFASLRTTNTRNGS